MTGALGIDGLEIDPLDAMAHFDAIAFIYDQLHAERRADIDFWVKQARLYGGPILELGCGTGRLLIPLAEAGLCVTGIDASMRMLEILRERMKNALDTATSDRMRVIEGRFPDAIPDSQFQQIFLPFGALQFLLTGQDRLLSRIREALVPGGRIVVDVTHYRGGESGTQDQPVRIYETDQNKVVLSRSVRYDSLRQILTKEFTLHVVDQDGTEETVSTHHGLRVYHRFEMELLLRVNGFRTIASYGDYQGNSLDGPSAPRGRGGRLIFIAQPTTHDP